jgi:hypothetical protein
LYLVRLGLLRRYARHALLRTLKIDPIKIEFDSVSGLPVVNYGSRLGVFIGRQFNPVHIALYACRALHLEDIIGQIYLPDLPETSGCEYVKRATSWLISNETQLNRRISLWNYSFPWPDYDLQVPWRCALAEAFGALVLLTTGHQDKARRHIQSILTDYRHTGVSYIEREFLFPLEYVSKERVLILNGILYCLLVLRHSSLILKDEAFRRGFDMGYCSIKSCLHGFDAGFYTFYDSLRKPAEEHYHRTHLELLGIMYRCTKDKDLLPLIARWSRYTPTYAIAEPMAILRYLADRALAKHDLS